MARKSQNKTLKIISNISFTIFMFIMIVLILLVGQTKITGMEPSLFGNRLYIVDSGSMEPTIKINSLIVVKEKPADEIGIGDIITYYAGDSSTRVTHRVVDEANNSEAFITRGDANNTNDIYPVDKGRIIGAVNLSIPYLGYALRFLSSTPGIVFIIGIGIMSIIVPMIFKKKESVA